MCDMRKHVGQGDVHKHFRVLEMYLNASEEEYIAPEIPVDFTPDPFQEFGEASKDLVHLSDEFVFLNHGAFGSTLKCALKTSYEYQIYTGAQPLKVLDRELIPHLAHVLRQLAKFIGCQPRDLTFSRNATEAINTVLKSIKYQPGDKILTTSWGYGAVQRSVSVVCEATSAEEKIVNISLPLTDVQSQFIDAVVSALTEDVKLVILDQIPSNQCFILPIKPIIDICRTRGILVMIDGSHSLGQLDLNVDELGADFFITNCHKWFMNTRGSALMHVRREMQDMIKPMVVSWGHGKGFAAEFIWSGTHGYNQYISLLTALSFWKNTGPEKIRSYCYSLVLRVEKMLREAWGVEQQCPDDLMCMMGLVKLPYRLNDPEWKPDIKCSKRDLLQDAIYFLHKIEVPVRLMSGVLYIRFSVHIYNYYEQYETLRDAVLNIAENRDQLKDYIAHFY